MWWEIIKNQSLATSQLGASMDWENEEIPDEEDDDCKMWLKGLVDILDNNFADMYGGITIDYIEELPENLACAIKEYYTRPVSSYWELSTVTGEYKINSFLDKYGVDRNKFRVVIDTKCDETFDIYLTVDDFNDGIKMMVGVGTQYLTRNDIFGDIEKNPLDFKKEMEEFFDGKHEITKRLCSFVKKYFEYIGQPSLIEEFLEDYADWWFWAEHRIGIYIGENLNPSERNTKIIERNEQYREAIKKYW
jgi:hypothetical protein